MEIYAIHRYGRGTIGTIGSGTVSALEVRRQMELGLGSAICPPRLLRAAQTVCFTVFQSAILSNPKAPASRIFVRYPPDALKRTISFEVHGQIREEEAEVFLSIISRVGVVSLAEKGHSLEAVLSDKVILRQRLPHLDWMNVPGSGSEALTCTLLERLDRRGKPTSVTKKELQDTSGMSRSALKRGLNRLEAEGVVIRIVEAGKLNLAWGPSVLKNAWRGAKGAKHLDCVVGDSGRSLEFGGRLKVTLPSGRVIWVSDGCKIEQVDQTLDGISIRNPD